MKSKYRTAAVTSAALLAGLYTSPVQASQVADVAHAPLQQLTSVVELHLEQIREHDGPNADLETAEAIASSLVALLRSDHDFAADERALVRGAVEYFLLADDASGDLESG